MIEKPEEWPTRYFTQACSCVDCTDDRLYEATCAAFPWPQEKEEDDCKG